MAFDIADLVAGTIDLDVRHPATNEKLGLTITIASQDDQEVAKVQRQNSSETDSDVQLDNVLMAAMKSFSWAEDANFNGEKLKANKNGKEKILSIPAIRRQVANTFMDYGRFFTG